MFKDRNNIYRLIILIDNKKKGGVGIALYIRITYYSQARYNRNIIKTLSLIVKEKL